MSRQFKTWLFIALAVLTAFLVWRLIRPMNIFLVSDAFEKPVDTSTIPAPLQTLSARECGACHLREGRIVGVLGDTDAPHPVKVLEAVVWYFLVGEKRRTRIGYENREPTAYQVFKQRVMLKRAGENEQT